MLVCAPFNTTHAAATLLNKTSGAATTVGFDATGSTVLSGAVAEWIVEHATTSKPSVLGDFGTVTIHECVAAGKRKEVDLLSATPINMIDGAGRVLAQATLDSRHDVTVVRTRN